MQSAAADGPDARSGCEGQCEYLFHSVYQPAPRQIPLNDYSELKRLIRQNGLLQKQPAYYIYLLLLLMGLLIVSLSILVTIRNPWLQLLNAAFLAFIFTQIGFISHDACHRQIFHTAWKNDLLSLLLGNLLLGMSQGWWTTKHNLHHGKPNQLDLDPDIDIPVLAFSEEQARNKQGLPRLIVKYQAYLFIPFLLLEAFSLKYHSIRFLVQKKAKYQRTEVLLLCIHFVLYLSSIFFFIGGWYACFFILVHQSLLGFYLSISFASNHKGMLMLDRESQMDFLRQQVLTTRNLKAHPFTDFVFGSLSCQIEHHLFPGMPRSNLRMAAKIVKAFCQERSIEYYETSVLQAYREILQHLHQVGASLRQTKEKNERKN
jgi:fatty acid desaturase